MPEEQEVHFPQLTREQEERELLLSSIKKARFLLESLIEESEKINYKDLRKKIGTINEAAQEGSYLGFQNREQTISLILPIKKVDDLRRVEGILLALNLVESKISSEDYLKLLDKLIPL